ncbi:hypothetical protein KWH75_06435 [Morganella morganii]|uniref:hypothetical protein n=1 Tax=Morganella morganii TaxID=582 RepID=UPI0021D25127|nr:hypothetical protein [Morganella morganii]MCU6236704.1 hypothetical protein [Morganella morganii]
MEIKKNQFWVYYVGEKNEVNPEKNGKWMYFFSDSNYVTDICTKAINENIVAVCKHTNNADTGVACFYLNIDDNEGHRRVIKFFLDNNLIKRTKSGKLTNASFKLDNQTRTGEYGDEFQAKLNLEKFVDLTTGEFI